MVASWGWWPGQWPAFELAAGRKLCAPGGGRAAGSALHELGELGSVTFPVEAKVKIQNSRHGKGAQACQSGCSGRVFASTWVRFWRTFEDKSNVHFAGLDGFTDQGKVHSAALHGCEGQGIVHSAGLDGFVDRAKCALCGSAQL